MSTTASISPELPATDAAQGTQTATPESPATTTSREQRAEPGPDTHNEPTTGHTTPLPSLSPPELRIFIAYFKANFAADAFLQTNPFEDFQEIYSNPNIQAHVAAATAALELGARAQAAKARQIVLTKAQSLAVNTQHPFERRRNLSLLLRATALPILPLRTPRPTEPRTPSSDPSTTSPVARLAEPCPAEPRGADNSLTAPQGHRNVATGAASHAAEQAGATRPTISPSPEGAQESQAPDNSAAQSQPNSAHPIGEGLLSPSSPLRGEVASRSEAGEGFPSPSPPPRGEVASQSEAGEGLLSPSSPLRGEVASRSEAGEGLLSPSSPLRGEVASQSEAGEGLPSSTTSTLASTTSANITDSSPPASPAAALPRPIDPSDFPVPIDPTPCMPGTRAFLDLHAKIPDGAAASLTPFATLQAFFCALSEDQFSTTPILAPFLLAFASDRLLDDINQHQGEEFASRLREYLRQRAPCIGSVYRATACLDPSDSDVISPWHIEYTTCRSPKGDDSADWQILITLARSIDECHPHNYSPWRIDAISRAVESG